MAIVTLIVAGAIVIVDQLLKVLVEMNLQYSSDVTLIPHILDITYVQNQGAAFGMMQGYVWLFSIITVAVVAVLIYIILTKKITHKLFMVSCSLIIGGALGNLIDRVFRGYVIDYLQLSFFPPVCNLADYCLTIGAVILIIYIIFYYKPQDKEDKIKYERRQR